jgi:uncharacterized protein
MVTKKIKKSHNTPEVSHFNGIKKDEKPELNSINVNELGKQLIESAKNNNLEKVEELINRGADINFKDEFNFTPLFWAVFFEKNIDVVRLLIEKNADLNVLNKEGTLLILAVKNGNTNTALLLIEKNANFNIQDNDGCDALYWAIHFNEKKVLRELIKSGANLNAQNNFGGTALIKAAWNNDAYIVHLLIENGADLNLQDKEGKTALDYAKKNNYTEIIELLNAASAKK